MVVVVKKWEKRIWLLKHSLQLEAATFNHKKDLEAVQNQLSENDEKQQDVASVMKKKVLFSFPTREFKTFIHRPLLSKFEIAWRRDQVLQERSQAHQDAEWGTGTKNDRGVPKHGKKA